MNVIHFIYPVTDRTRPWSLLNQVTVDRALRIQKPDKVFFWTNVDAPDLPEGVEVVREDLPDDLASIPPQYISDIMRLRILHDHGGVYMDTDMLLLAPLHTEVEKLTISWETADCSSICNALMISPPRNAFVAEWLERMPEAVQSPTWAYGGVVLPMELAHDLKLSGHRTILPHTFACPLDLSRNWLFDPSMREQARDMIWRSNAIHGFETYWRNEDQSRPGTLFDELRRDA